MKYLYLVWWIILLIVLIILYFQWIIEVSWNLPFFAQEIGYGTYFLYTLIMAFCSGVLMTLGVQWVLNDNNDDDFSL